MIERKPCIRCERAIDRWASRCPFCNWDQSATPPVREVVPVQVAEYKPPEERSVKQYAWYGLVGVLMLIVSFGIGMLINRDGAPEKAPEPVAEKEQHIPKVKKADTPLVPVNEPGGIEQPITSAPSAAAPAPGGTAPNQYDRTDATAVSASEYAQMAKRAQAEKKKMAVLVDPRTLTGPAFAQAPRRTRPATPAPAPAASTGQQLPFPNAPMPAAPRSRAESVESPRVERRAVMRTRPVPQYQPLPNMRAYGTARFDLLVGADGRVKDITVRRALDGNTAALIGQIQRWRFKPATENGEPVASSFSVEISFGGR